MKEFIAAFSGLQKYFKRCHGKAAITIYSEGKGDWTHFEDIVDCLSAKGRPEICFLTSDKKDPAFNKACEKFVVCYVGMGLCRTWLFKVLKSPVALMTMPDLETFHLKRSRHPVTYVYTFHSLNSTHMAYRPGAFDAFDAILCTGPHHIEEIRMRERQLGLREKDLVRAGYPRLDRLLQTTDRQESLPASARNIVVAPTWGSTSFIEHECRTTLISTLLSSGWTVNLRLHPMTVRHRPDIVRDLQNKFSAHPSVKLQLNVSEFLSLTEASLMISDWSGAALEFALGLGRPVLFIDTPPKVRNPNYKGLGIVPLEARLREELGAVVPIGEISRVPGVATQLILQPRQETIQQLRNRLVYNLGSSARVAADYLLERVSQSSLRDPASSSLDAL